MKQNMYFFVLTLYGVYYVCLFAQRDQQSAIHLHNFFYKYSVYIFYILVIGKSFFNFIYKGNLQEKVNLLTKNICQIYLIYYYNHCTKYLEIPRKYNVVTFRRFKIFSFYLSHQILRLHSFFMIISYLEIIFLIRSHLLI